VGDFALVNLAAAMRLSGSTIQRVQLAVNGVAARPLRLRAAEAALQGQRRTQQAAEAAAQIAVQGAEPLQHNGYKVTLMRNLIKRAVRGGAEATWAS
jgi:xanthine dehydrogenase YagS FAD-binding subunit